MVELDLVVFDMAGTTVEDGGQVPAAFTAALADFGIHVTPAQINAVRGASKRQAIRQFMPSGLDQARHAEIVYNAFRDHLARLYTTQGVRSVPGAAHVFAALRERGIRVALNTGFDRDTTTLLLDALGWATATVDAIVCGDEVPQGRPAPYLIFHAMQATGTTSVHRVANVGDTTLDLQAGHNAGVAWNIGVLSGAHDRQQLGSAPHTHLVASVADLSTLWFLD